MAKVDVSQLITDPMFSDGFVLIKRKAPINEFGEMDLIETASNQIGVIQNISNETLERFPDAAQYMDGITVWYRGELEAESSEGYCDVVVWLGQRYLVKKVSEQFMNWASGWTSALCSKEVANV